MPSLDDNRDLNFTDDGDDGSTPPDIHSQTIQTLFKITQLILWTLLNQIIHF